MARFAPWLTLFLLACATRTETVALSVRLSDDPSCRPAMALDEIRLTALGDFGAVGATAIAMDGQGLDSFPPSTEAFRGTIELPGFTGAGMVLRRETSVLRLAPLDVPCVSSLPPSIVREAAYARTSEGGFVVVGGLDEGSVASRTVRIVGQGVASDRTLMLLQTRRALASAHITGEKLIVVGGALGDTGPALDTLEVVDLRTGLPLSSAVLTTPRRDHGSTLLADGRVLVVGGRASDDGAALDSAEVVGETGFGVPTASLPFERIAPAVVKLDDGAIFVLGGFGAGGSPFSTSSVFAWSPSGNAFTDRSNDVSVRPYARFIAVPLVGGRIVWVGDSRPGLSSALLRVLHHVLPDVDVPSLEQSDLDLRAQMPDLVAVVATPLDDGRFLMMGRDSAMAPRGFVVDIGRALATEVDVVEAPEALITLADGTVAAFGATAITTYRFRVVSPWDTLPVTIIPEELAFDIAAHWDFLPSLRFGARVDGARFDLPTVRFSDFEATWLVESGQAELLLVSARGLLATVNVRPDEVGVGLCRLTRAPGEEVGVERRGTRLVISTSAGSRRCTGATLRDDVGIAVRASNGAIVRAPRVDRR